MIVLKVTASISVLQNYLYLDAKTPGDEGIRQQKDHSSMRRICAHT